MAESIGDPTAPDDDAPETPEPFTTPILDRLDESMRLRLEEWKNTYR